MGSQQGLRATAWAESVGKEIGVASGTACSPRIGRGRLEAKRQPGCDPGVLADQTGEELSQSGGRGSGRELLASGHSEAALRLLGDAPVRATPRGGARRGRAARCGAARPLGKPQRTAQVRARVGGRGPLPHEFCGGSELSPSPAATVMSPPSSVSASSSRSRGHPAPV